VGTTFQLTRSNVPKKPDFRVTEFEPNKKISAVFTSGPAKGTAQTFRLETVEGKTKLTRTLDVKYSGLYKLAGPFMTGSVRKQTESDLSNTKRILESGAKP
jgi:hypothetical protein